MNRLPVREDLTRQTEVLATARAVLAGALEDLAAEALAAAKVARSRAKWPRHVDVDRVRAATRDVYLAEEAHDLAGYDVRTASGEDG